MLKGAWMYSSFGVAQEQGVGAGIGKKCTYVPMGNAFIYGQRIVKQYTIRLSVG
jgi:hypothetical protein